MRGRYRLDAVLRAAMLAVSLVLAAAWLYKALTVKDALFGQVLGNVQESEAEERMGQVWRQGKQRAAGILAEIVRACGPIGRTAADEISADREREPAGGLSGSLDGGQAAGAVPGTGETAGASAAERLAALVLRILDGLAGRSPICRFLAAEDGMDTGTAADPDPSYAGYLARQKLMNEAWYLALYGDENSREDGREILEEMPQTEGILSGEQQERNQQDTAFLQLGSLTPAYHRRDGIPVTGTAYVLEQLMDYDVLMQNFYSVHASTTAGRDEMDAAALLAKDLSIVKDSSQPQILIYHTHSQETFCDYGPDNPEATVVGIGSRLTQLLEEKGYKVIHDTTTYDIMNGELDRNHAYNYALEGITAILQQNPSIQVVLDVHRDGVGEGVRLVSEVNGRPTAKIMFFNGMSQTPEGPIEYLPNPYREDNLAFSLQMQLDAAAYYPGLTRKIYLKGLRYNLHVRPRSALIEVGAQTNTYEEALNAMDPLAELLDMVLGG